MPRMAPIAGILLLGVLIGAFRLTEALDLKLLDAQFTLLRAFHPREVEREVAIVGVDEDSARQFPEPLTLWHAHLGRLLAALARAHPAVVGVDLVLPDRSYEPVLPGSDKALLQGLLEARRSYP